MSTETIWYLIPELVLVAVATLIYLGGAFFPRRSWLLLAIAGVVGAGIALATQYSGLFAAEGDSPATLAAAVGGPVLADLLGRYIRWLALASGLLFVLLTARPGKDVPAAEYVGTLLMGVAGVMLVASARDLVLLFVGLELLSIPTYVLLYVGQKNAASQESAVKYFFLSLLSSALLLYGFSFLYGIGGSTDLAVLRDTLAIGPGPLAASRLLARVGLVLVFAGLGFRIAAVPFHFYAPDVYQGTTNGNAGLLAVFPKIAGFVALVRIVAVALVGMEAFGWRVALVLAVLTMTLGNLLALWQDNIRRLLAYSSIAHAGYMLIGLAAALATLLGAPPGAPDQPPTSFDGVAALLFYLVVYVLATTGTFAALAYLGRPDRQIDGVDELAGLGRTHPIAALTVAAFMFSLAGIPPLAGFWGKLTLLASALGVDGGDAASPLRGWFIALAIVGVLNAAVAATYYLRIVAVMYFRSPVAHLKAQGGPAAALAMIASGVAVVVLGCYPAGLVQSASLASRSTRAVATKQVALASAAELAPAGTSPAAK